MKVHQADAILDYLPKADSDSFVNQVIESLKLS
jgi:hypothetical protein